MYSPGMSILEWRSALGRPIIVAELSGNHGQNLGVAKAMVAAAAEAGADAIKLQTYTPDTMTLPLNSSEFRIEDAASLWKGQSLYDLYSKAFTPWEWHDELFQYAHSLGLVAFSSPFDETAVSFLESLNCPFYKIASFELVDIPLITRAANTGKPLIMSTGMATIEEISEAVDAARRAGVKELVLLKCTSAYPAAPSDCHLKTIEDMKERFQCPVGLSDHTQGIGVPLASVAWEPCLVEKHFTLDRKAGGVDADFSLEPPELKLLVTEITRASQAVGEVHYGGSPAENAEKVFRRSIYARADIPPGSVISRDDLAIIRPGYGLAPKHIDQVVGATAATFIRRGDPIRWDALT